VDAGFPDDSELSIDEDGTSHPKKLTATTHRNGMAEFEQEIRLRMPERHLLDIIENVEHWARYTRHFGPPSGADPKLAQAVQRYIFTVFGYGCNLGPTQWRLQGQPEEVQVYDFLSRAVGRAVPHGIYDLAANAGWLGERRDRLRQIRVRGTNHPPLAAGDRAVRYPDARHLVITADGGGSNGSRV
jgi:hypothetical protein